MRFFRDVLLGAALGALLGLAALKASAGEANLSWTNPTTNEDGTPLTDLAGIKVYWGNESGNYTGNADIASPDVETFTVQGIAEGDWFFVVTAYDTSGNESDYSNEVSKVIAIAPSPPTELLVADLTAFTVVKQVNRFVLLPVGTVPAGTPCDSSQRVNGHYAVPRDQVTWSGNIQPVVVVAQCT